MRIPGILRGLGSLSLTSPRSPRIRHFRSAVESMKAKAKEVIELFPDWAFPPALPFKTAVTAAAA
jgi:hypothetical protein